MMMEPKIRLKGFCGEWKTQQIGDICQISTGKSNTQDKIDDGQYPFYVRSPHIERSNKYLYDEEAVLTVGDGVGTGKVFHYVNGKYDLHQRVYRMYNFTSVDAKYFYYIFSTKFYKRVMAMTAKSSVDSVRLDMIADMKISCPSKDEQRALATFFTSLDNQISAAEKRLASLKQVKAASLQAMFPQEGETTPKLRFKGCEGEWKKVKLGEIVRLKAGNSLSLAQLKEWGSYPCYGGNGIRTYLPFFSHDGEYNLIGRVGALCGNINYVNGKFYATEHALVVYPFDDINVRFLFYVLVFADLNKYKKGCAQPVLSASTLYNVDIIIPPSLPEQRQIASYFTALDRQITAQSSKISKLKQIKSACLDQMFV